MEEIKRYKCKTCGADLGELFAKADNGVVKCPYCDSVWDFGFSDEEQNRLNEAQSDLRRQEFDVAEEKFYDIINDYPDNHEAYWVLS